MKYLSPLRLTAFWIVLCAYLNCAGWILSAIHQLNSAGYAVSLALGAVLLFLYLRTLGEASTGRVNWKKFRWRTGKGLPAIFFVVALLVFIGGAIYPPNNYDGLTYRFPRVLHWLAEGRWHWIEAPDRRVNLSAAGFEWLMAPLFALSRSDRGFFLINLVPYLLLPGLTFSTFVRLGIPKRVAWHWMWLLPCGYCFVLQAGSIGNDSFAAVFLLAALCFGLRARETGNFSDFSISILAAALLTGAKASNLPLLLPCFLACIPNYRLVLTKPLLTALVGLIAVSCTFVPIAAMNAYYTGDWTGDPANASQMKLDSPVYGVIGNILQLAVNNVQLPVMPFASAWNAAAPKLLDTYFHEMLVHFPLLGLKWGELANEEGSGIGLGLTALALASLAATVAGLFGSKKMPPRVCSNRLLGIVICASGLAALLVLMSKFGNEGAGRLIAPYYPIVLACVLLPQINSILVRKRAWQIAALIAALFALPCAILTPSRPLFPAGSIFDQLASSHPTNRLIQRGKQVYAVYANRWDNLAPIRKHLPADARKIGFINADVSEVSLWRPFGSRKVLNLSRSTKPQTYPSIIVCSEESMNLIFGISVAQWVRSNNAQIIATEKFTNKASRGAEDWFVIALKKPGGIGL